MLPPPRQMRALISLIRSLISLVERGNTATAQNLGFKVFWNQTNEQKDSSAFVYVSPSVGFPSLSNLHTAPNSIPLSAVKSPSLSCTADLCCF